MNAIQTAGKTNGNEVNSIKIGMKLSDSLVSGRYTNKLVFSIFTNNYDHIAIMTDGYDFNAKLKALETRNGKIEHFKKNTVSPVASVSAVNIEDEDSDYEIKLWLDPIDKTAYYYTESEKVYLNNDAHYMFYGMRNLTTLNLSNFDTSKVTNMSYMFSLRDYDELMDKLEKIYVNNDFDTTKLTNFSDMFRNRKKLRGGNGSYLSDPTTADKSWLRIDDPANGRPGYFTRKP